MGKHTAGRGASADPLVIAALAHRPPDRVGAHRSNGSSRTAPGLGWPGPTGSGDGAIGWPGGVDDSSSGHASSGEPADEDDETERVA